MFNSFFVSAQVNEWKSSGCLINAGGVEVPTLKCLEVVFSNILVMSSALIVLILFVMLVVGSVQYLTSLGDPERVKKARGTLKYALYGFLLFAGAYLILFIIDVLFLGGEGKVFKFELPGP